MSVSLAEALLRADHGSTLEALRSSTVIVPTTPAGTTTPATAPAMAGQRVTWVFSDEEAYRAWTIRLSPQLVSSWTVSRFGGGAQDLGPVLERGGIEDLGPVLGGAGVDQLVVNPAGPGTAILPVPFGGISDSSRAVGDVSNPKRMRPALADPALRFPNRHDIDRAIAEGRRRLSDGDRPGVDLITSAGRIPAGEIGDAHASATFDELIVRAHLVGDPVDVTLIRAVLKAAEGWSRIGQPLECARLLVIAGQRATAAIESDDPEPWLRQALAFVAGQLAVLDVPECRSDAKVAMAEARRYS